MRHWWSALVLVCAVSPAFAEERTTLQKLPPGTLVGEGRLKMAVTPPEQFRSSPPAEVSNVLYLNRCTGGCMVTGGTTNDARQRISTYIAPGPHVVSEYQNNERQTGSAADAEWNALVQCIREIYSPFNVVVTDTPPTGTGNYTEAIIGGTSEDVGLDSAEVGGVAPAHTSCAANDNALSYSFANNSYYFHNASGGLTGTQLRVNEICYVAGQESAHHYGLDHSFEYFDGSSACNDPMTYRTDCAGQKFFRNKAAKCGEFSGVRECMCGGLQNTHQKILSVFGPGTGPQIPPPTVSITSPANGATATNGQVVSFSAGSKRGVARSDLYLNGYKWGTVEGAAYGQNGQPNPSTYNILFPSAVPDGVIDIEVRAYDDLEANTTSATIRVTKGAPCTSASTCAKGQQCDGEGRCYWEPPTGQLGDSCDYNQFCESNMCIETTDGALCSQDCVVGAADSCPMDYECVANGASGACIPTSGGGGCCSVGGAGGLWGHALVSLGALGLVLRRRRRARR